MIFLSITVPFHRVSFDHSISCVLLIDKPNESCQNFKKFKRNAISAIKKLLKTSGNSITQAKTNAPISQTSEGLKLIIQTYQMRNKELKMKLGQLEAEISKASLPVSDDLCNNALNLNQCFWKLTKEKFTLHEVNFGGAAKISSLLSIMLHYHPMNPDADVTYQTVN